MEPRAPKTFAPAAPSGYLSGPGFSPGATDGVAVRGADPAPAGMLCVQHRVSVIGAVGAERVSPDPRHFSRRIIHPPAPGVPADG